MKKQIPYGQTFTLNHPLENVECWNFSSRDTFTLPAGLLVKLNNVNDSTHTTVCVVDEKGNAPGIELEYVQTFHSHISSTYDRSPIKQTGYRFIVENQALGAAIGIKIPKKTADLVGDIIAYETGAATPKQTTRLFSTLRKTGIGRGLQGHYSSRM